MAGANTNIFSQTKTLNDFTQEDAINAFKQQIAMAQLQKAATGANLPAALQLTNEYQKRLAAGDTEGANTLYQFAKIGEKGLLPTADGGVALQPGFVPAVSTIAGAKAGAEANAKNASELTYAAPTAAASETGKATGLAQGAITTKAINAPAAISVLDQIDAKDASGTSLLDRATGSTFGQLGAGLNQAIGRSTPATQANSELAVLGNTLVSNVPRMQGPQSDKDVQFYKEQAGKISDPSVPAGDKRAAIKAIRALQEKYAASGGVLDLYPGENPTGNFKQTLSNPPSSSGWSIKRLP